LFISFEGIDGSGKSTQVERIAAWLREKKLNVLVTREPGGTPLGEAIRGILLDDEWHTMTARAEFLLYSASRAQLVDDVIKPHLKKPDSVVIVDRYDDSSTAYQGAGRELGMDTIQDVNRFVTTGLKPDITFVLDVDWETSRARLGKANPDRLENNPRDFFERVREGYFELARREPERVKIIDAKQTPDKIFSEIQGYLKNLL
jgi:dTMP kinase